MIEVDGPISVATFMVQALHDREMGFYATRESVGGDGAFVTAPEISQVFGELIGLWCVSCWSDQGCPARPLLVELGPGRGTLMIDMLRAFRRMPEFLDTLEIVLVEASAKLESVQRNRFVNAGIPVRWSRRWEDIAFDRPLFVVANEFFDALPVRQFVMTQRGWCERMVTFESDSLEFTLSPQPLPFSCNPDRGDAAVGAVYEVCPAATSLMEDVARRVAANRGAALVIDYGYEQPGYGDTLQAVRSHKYDNVLGAPGEADLSSHVDFSALVRATQHGGASAWGPISQGRFLRNLGIETRARQLALANPPHASEIELAVRRLVDENAMGELFKVLSVVPTKAPQPPGFC